MPSLYRSDFGIQIYENHASWMHIAFIDSVNDINFSVVLVYACSATYPFLNICKILNDKCILLGLSKLCIFTNAQIVTFYNFVLLPMLRLSHFTTLYCYQCSDCHILQLYISTNAQIVTCILQLCISTNAQIVTFYNFVCL